ncbi:hypothetical protein GCM10011380_07670 [Sphingomonas metalli]|uniref:tRNA(Ile)-lysidine synthase n=1 Tax=Sphingomonas metalli TaxID=1779358 RepID=A0A916WPK9_9SPHN|nr:tRNA lysidine(34) synthetase TilS [Sphingomonas metalli]GGB20555.1 hypothetical protein GCM10011380_07670 [Sphingomonas metalli]
MLAPDLVTRFAADLAALTGEPHPPLALAVSGGPDSMAMLALAAAALPGDVIAATFDHRLRAESAGEAAMVARWCADHAIPHAVLTPARPIAANSLQARARTARYAALAAWAAGQGARFVATAHHADDQAETMLMRANRASGVAGLSGIRRRRPLGAVMLVRPLLGWRRAELAAIVAALALPVVDDPSNRDPRFARARVRQWLAAIPELDTGSIARSADHLAEMLADWEQLADRVWSQRPADAAIDVADQPRTLRRLLLRRLIAAVRASHAIVRPPFGPETHVEAMLDALAEGRRATQGGVVVTPRGTVWTAAPAPPRRDHA